MRWPDRPYVTQHFHRAGTILLSLLVLFSCSGQLEKRPVESRKAGVEQSVEKLLAQAEQGESRSVDLRLQAVQLALNNQDFSSAHQIVKSLKNNSMSPSEALEFIRLQARLAIAQGWPERGIELLQPVKDLTPLSKLGQIGFSQLLARAYYDNHQYYSSATQLIRINTRLTGDDRQNNHELIWRSLNELSLDNLWSLAKRADEGDVRGWLSLVSLSKRYSDSPTRQLEELTKWLKIWAQHAAASGLPKGLRMLAGIVSDQARHIAVMLPLSGDMAPLGRAIRDGLLAAHYTALQPAQTYPQIQFYDSAAIAIEILYDQVVADGAELIIGPLDRDRVTRLQQVTNRLIPALALNRSTTNSSASSSLFYQFALAPEDEVQQVVSRAWRDGFRRVMMMAPDDEWGIRNGILFRELWLARGGSVIEEQYYSTRRDYSDVVQALLDIDSSKERASQLKRITGKKFEFSPRRRKDIDFIFLLANPTQARGIIPSLAYFYADDLPVYATSHIYDNSGTTLDLMDLNGVRFCDIPFKLTDRSSLHSAIDRHWHGVTGALAPFYALGIDAYHLYPRLNQLRELPREKFFGTTGILVLDDEGTIIRQLIWAQVKNGVVLPMPSIGQKPASPASNHGS